MFICTGAGELELYFSTVQQCRSYQVEEKFILLSLRASLWTSPSKILFFQSLKPSSRIYKDQNIITTLKINKVSVDNAGIKVQEVYLMSCRAGQNLKALSRASAPETLKLLHSRL